MPAVINRFEILIDANWAKENTDLDFGPLPAIRGPNNEIFIEEDNGKKYSLRDLGSRLAPLDGSEFGVFTDKVRFESGFISGPDFKYKIKGYNIEYTLLEPYSRSTIIDGSKELIGVIEYLQKGTKKSIFREGVIRENLLSR